jgi:hypothetical protein
MAFKVGQIQMLLILWEENMTESILLSKSVSRALPSATIKTTMRAENLLSLKDDMVAFIEGHGMRRLPGYITEDIPSILWEDEDNQDSWKDFVEMAKASGAPFLTMSTISLDHDEIEILLERVRDQNFPDEDASEIADAQWLERFAGKAGYIQLGFIHQGVAFLHESSTEWYERYQELLEQVEGFGDIVIDDSDDEEK